MTDFSIPVKFVVLISRTELGLSEVDESILDHSNLMDKPIKLEHLGADDAMIMLQDDDCVLGTDPVATDEAGKTYIFQIQACDAAIHTALILDCSCVCWIGNLISVEGVLGGLGMEMVEEIDQNNDESAAKAALSPKSNDEMQDE